MNTNAKSYNSPPTRDSGEGVRLSPHFRLVEFTQSPTARRLGIRNEVNSQQLANLTNLCRYVLEPLRKCFGQPIYVNSGYRCPKLNRAVGGAVKSYHLYGRAADIVAGVPASQMKNEELRMKNQREGNRRLLALIREMHLPLAELIAEKPDRSGAPRWIHVAI